MKRTLTAILMGVTLLAISACGQPASHPLDSADHNDPVAYQKAYCQEQGWTYEPATNTCKR